MSESSLFRLLETQAKTRSSHVATRTRRGGSWEWTTWGDYHEAAGAIALALMRRGVQRGDKVAIFGGSREEWTLADFGALAAGAVTVPIYPTATEEQALFILKSSGARLVFAEGRPQLEALAGAADRADSLSEIVVIDPSAEEPTVAGERRRVPTSRYVDLVRDGHAALGRGTGRAELEARLQSIGPADLATIVYTSGTTGPPRGALLTHGALLAEVRALQQVFTTGHDDEQLLMLPLAHILARALVFAHVATGSKLAFVSDAHRLMTDFEEVRPTFFASVPRFFEKVHAVATRSASAEGPLKARLWSWAVGIGLEASREKRRRGRVSGLLSARARYADRLSLARVRRSFGGKLRWAISGGAPLGAEVAEWFHACGILVLEGYGLTEAGGASHVNREDTHRFGTVGLPLPGVEARTAADGEVLLRSPTLMTGYAGDDAATRLALDAEGFLHTGDIGRIDRDGFLTIVDRKKDVIVTAGGSKVSPQNLEGMLAASPWIEHAVVFGDRKPYLVALLGLDVAVCQRWAEDRKRPSSLPDLARDPELHALVQMDVDAANRRLSSYETVKRFLVLDRALSVSTGELTETGKVRRSAVAEHFSALLTSLYDP